MATKETRKLCKHSMNGGCHYGSACNSWHPVSSAAAAAEWHAKKTLNVCSFHPHCGTPSCTYLHVDLAPRGAAPPAGPPTRQAPQGRTPPRPAELTARTGPHGPPGLHSGPERRGGPATGRAHAEKRRGRAVTASRPHSEAGLPRAGPLHEVHLKIEQLRRAEASCRSSAKTLSGAFAQELQKRAEQAAEMQTAVLAKLVELSGVLDSYLTFLGASPEAPDAEARSPLHELRESFEGESESSQEVDDLSGPDDDAGNGGDGDEFDPSTTFAEADA